MIISKRKYEWIMDWVFNRGITKGWELHEIYIKGISNNRASILGVEDYKPAIEEAERIVRNENSNS